MCIGETSELQIVVHGKEGVRLLTDPLQLRGQREEILSRGVLIAKLHNVDPPAHAGSNPKGQVWPGVGNEQEASVKDSLSRVHAAIRLGGQAATSRRRA